MFGLKNTVDPQYPDIIWFKLGTYVITNFSYSYSTAGMSISISGKDKMCLVNGDVSGAIYASVDFGTREEVDSVTGEKTLVDIEIEDIIREAVHEYAREPWERIIIKDLPKYGLFLLEWTADVPIYVLIPATGKDESVQAIINQDATVYIDGTTPVEISDLPHYMTTNDLTLIDKSTFTVITIVENGENEYFVCRILPGQTAGYDVTELTYPRNGEESGLITSIGDSVTTVLDKIVEFLGNYEYFYDVDGNFIFQKKDKYIDTNWNVNDFNTTSMGNDYDLTAYLQSSWLFEGNELVVSINNTPNLNNIKNDYAIWGERQVGDDSIPIHMRYAVDKKPQYYKSIFVSADELRAYKELYPEFENAFRGVDGDGNWPSKIYYTEELNDKYIYQKTEDTERLLGKKYFIFNNETKEYEEYDGELQEGIDYYEYTDLFVGIESHEVDWREIIYQMALDYRRFNHFDTFNMRILQNNILPNGNILYPKGITGYEQYYVDLEGFWRYLYRPDYDSDLKFDGYSIKTVSEIDIQEPVYIADHQQKVDDSSTDGTNRYQAITGENSGPSLIERPYDYDIDKYLEELPMISEYREPEYIYPIWIGSSEGDDGLAQDGAYNLGCTGSINSHDSPMSQYGRGIYYKNGGIDTNYYDYNGHIKYGPSDGSWGSFQYEAANLLVPCTIIDSLETLQNAIADVTLNDQVYTSLTEGQKTFIRAYNTYRVYKVENTEEYYMLKKVKGEGLQYNNISFEPFRVRVSFKGVQDYYSGDYIYRRVFNYNKCAVVTKIGIIDFLPSTMRYEDLCSTPGIEGIISGKFAGQYDEEKHYKLRNIMMLYNRYVNNAYFNFSEDPLKKSMIELNTADTNKINVNSAEVSDFLDLFKNQNNQFKQYYSYIERDNLGRPVNDSYTHSPIAYYQETYSQHYDESYNQWWNTLIEESPELLIFWFDFLDSQTSEIGKYGANNIMDRSKANNDSKVKAIYYRDTLNIVYQRLAGQTKKYDMLVDQARSGQNIIQAGAWVWDYFKVSSCGKSCKDVLDQWLQAYTQANESINFNCIPIYTLEPNNRISIQDDNTKINGEYVINSINIPLTFNGTMSVNATKAVSKLQ